MCEGWGLGGCQNCEFKSQNFGGKIQDCEFISQNSGGKVRILSCYYGILGANDRVFNLEFLGKMSELFIYITEFKKKVRIVRFL